LPKLLIAVNEEGGQINALKPENFPAIKQCADQGLNLSQADIGKTGDIKLAKKQSYCIAEALKEYGINVNLAPVAAIEVNPDSDVIAKWGRSYGNTEQIVTDYLKSSLDGYKKASVISVLKHFPGLGSAKDNTDFGGMVNITDTWQESEGNVYRNLISNFSVSPMIMVSFAMNTTLDESGLPAALSYNMVTKLLRKDMDYNGVIMTDDLNASAIMDYFSRKQATYLAVNAGSNMLIFGGGLGYDATKETDIFYNNLVDLYTKDSAFAKKVDTSVKYIKSLKQVL
jgi:beta-N-acetylhexosaminidase